MTREICNWTKEQENKDSTAAAISRGQRKTSSDLNFLARTGLWPRGTIARILKSDLSAACKQISSNSSSFSSPRKRTLQANEQQKADEWAGTKEMRTHLHGHSHLLAMIILLDDLIVLTSQSTHWFRQLKSSSQ
jgi:hypothetical protein